VEHIENPGIMDATVEDGGKLVNSALQPGKEAINTTELPALANGAREGAGVVTGVAGAALDAMNTENFQALANGAGIVAETALNAVAGVAIAAASAGPPISLALGPLGMAIGGVVQAADGAKGCTREAEALSQRAKDCGDRMAEVVNVCNTLPVEQAESVTRTIERLTTTLDETAQFLKKFGKKGFLGKMMSNETNVRDFKKFADRITS
jgi:hypothetical protein